MPVDEETANRLLELTKRLRRGDDRAGVARERLLAAADVEARVRDDPNGAVLVLYPIAWIEDGTVDPDAVGDPDVAMELPLERDRSGDEAEYAAIAAHNDAVAEAVRRRHGPVHGETAAALATYLSNHHLVRVEAAMPAQLRTFREEYFPRNAWPTHQQRHLVDRSIAVTRQTASRLSGDGRAVVELFEE